jgi:spore coat protein CotH
MCSCQRVAAIHANYHYFFYRFIRQSLYGGEKADVGLLIKGDAGKGEYAADLFYRGANSSVYDPNTYEVRVDGDPEGAAMNKLVEFMEFISTYQPTNTESDMAAWSTWLDVDTYMRSMVIEWLTGNWDGHVYSKSHVPLF